MAGGLLAVAVVLLCAVWTASGEDLPRGDWESCATCAGFPGADCCCGDVGGTHYCVTEGGFYSCLMRDEYECCGCDGKFHCLACKKSDNKVCWGTYEKGYSCIAKPSAGAVAHPSGRLLFSLVVMSLLLSLRLL